MKKVEKTSAAEIHPAIKSHIGHLRLLWSSSAGEVILLSAVAEPVAWSSGWNSGDGSAGFDDARTKRKPQPRAAPLLFRLDELASAGPDGCSSTGRWRALDGEPASAVDDSRQSGLRTRSRSLTRKQK
jgi:hypothetical protein